MQHKFPISIVGGDFHAYALHRSDVAAISHKVHVLRRIVIGVNLCIESLEQLFAPERELLTAVVFWLEMFVFSIV